MSRLPAGEEARAPRRRRGPARVLPLRRRGCSRARPGGTGRAGTHTRARRRALVLPQQPRPPPSPSRHPLLGVPPPSSGPRCPALHRPRPHQRNSFRSLKAAGVGVGVGGGRGEARAPAALAPWAARRAGWDRRREERGPSSGRGRRRGHLWSPEAVVPVSSCVPRAARANSGGSCCKVSESGVGSCKRSTGRGADAGRRGQALLAASLFCSGGKTWQGVAGRALGPPAATLRTLQGLFAPDLLLRAAPHPQPNRDGASSKSSSLLPYPKLHLPAKSQSLGWGKKEGGGEGARWAGYLPKGGCLLWNVWVLFLRPRSCLPTRPPIFSISPTSRLSSSSILVKSRRKMSAARSPSESQCGGP